MKHLLNTLYISLDGAYVHREGKQLVICFEHNTLQKFPIHILNSLVCFGRISVSPGALKLCTEYDVGVSFVDMFGRFIGKFTAPVHGNVLLRRKQYRQADNKKIASEYAKSMLIGKIANSRAILQRAFREHPETKIYNPAIKYLANRLGKLNNDSLTDLNELRGIEGDCAVTYFSCFDNMILRNKDKFYFKNRNRRPPTDKVNALLSLGYTLLAADVASALETVGLDPYVGFLHCDRPGRQSLALDLVEEFRAYLVDRFVLKLINLKQIKAKDFIRQESGAVMLTDEGRKKIFLPEWQKRKKETVIHPYLKEKVSLGLLPYIQATLLAKAIRGQENYPPFLVK